MYTPDIQDVDIMLEVDKHASIEEIADRVHLAGSTTHERVTRLIEEGYIAPPRKTPTGRAISRGHELTQFAQQYLVVNGYKPQRIWAE